MGHWNGMVNMGDAPQLLHRVVQQEEAVHLVSDPIGHMRYNDATIKNGNNRSLHALIAPTYRLTGGNRARVSDYTLRSVSLGSRKSALCPRHRSIPSQLDT